MYFWILYRGAYIAENPSQFDVIFQGWISQILLIWLYNSLLNWKTIQSMTSFRTRTWFLFFERKTLFHPIFFWYVTFGDIAPLYLISANHNDGKFRQGGNFSYFLYKIWCKKREWMQKLSKLKTNSEFLTVLFKNKQKF